MAKNIQSLQLLRNTSQLYETRETALAKLTGSTPAGTQDGTPVLARYKGTDGKIYTLVGYYAASSAITGGDSATSNMTVFDFEGSAADVDKLRQEINARLGDGVTSANTATAQFAALSGTPSDTSATTSVAGAKKYADDKVAEELSKLTATTQSGESKVIIDVTQDKGKITTTSANLTGVKLDGYSEGSSEDDIAATDTLGAALGKLQHQIKEMDLAAVGAEGSVITSVSEDDGKVSATATPVKDVLLTGYVKDTTKTGDILSTDDIEDALSKLENKAAAITIKNDDGSINVTTGADGTNINVNINSTEKVIKKDGNGGLYTDLDLVKITENLPTTVKERYQLLASDDSQIGANIDIYKDSSISKIYLGYSDDTVDENTGVITSGTTGEPQSLNYVYHKEDGKYEMVHVDVSKFLVESEFASGVTADTTGVVHGVVDSNSEKDSQTTPEAFLTVGADGFKISGIKAEIDRKINALNATAGTQTIATGKHVAVEVVETSGKVSTVTVVEDNIASKSELDALSAKTFTVATSSNASITTGTSAASDGTVSVDLITDASKIQMSGFTSTDVLSGITSSSSITEAFKEVDKVITENEETVSAALNGLNTKLSDETAARKAVDGQNGDKYAANAGVPYISAATSLNDADVILANQISSIAGGWIEGVQVNGADVPEADNKVNIQIRTSQNAASSGEGIVITQDASTKGLTFALGSIDAGTY